MAIIKGNIKRLTASGVVTTADKVGRLKAVYFFGATNDDQLDIRDGGSGGTIRHTMKVQANGFTQFTIPEGALFTTDIYATLTIGGTAYATFVYDELS